jgi:hypothetical protein
MEGDYLPAARECGDGDFGGSAAGSVSRLAGREIYRLCVKSTGWTRNPPAGREIHRLRRESLGRT